MTESLRPSDYEPSSEFLLDTSHTVSFRATENGDVYLECSSRLALYEFARSLLAESAEGTGWAEYYPLGFEGERLVVNGARLADGSSRLFVAYP